MTRTFPHTRLTSAIVGAGILCAVALVGSTPSAADEVTKTIPVGTYPIGVAFTPDGAAAYVANWSDDTLSKVDTATGSVTETIAVGGSAPNTIAISPVGDFGYVTLQSSDSIIRLDTSADTVGAPIAGFGGPTGVTLSSDGSFALVGNSDDDTVTKVNTADDSLEAPIAIGDTASPTAIAIADDMTFALATNRVANTISRINLGDNSVTNLAVGPTPVSVDISDDGSFAYVVTNGNDSVSRVNLVDMEVTDVIPVGDQPSQVILSSDDSFAYVTNSLSDTTSRIRVSDNTVLSETPVGDFPSRVAIAPDDSFAYVTNISSNDVSRLVYAAPPTMTSVSPSTGPQAGGTSITISGTGFLPGPSIEVGGVACTNVEVLNSTTATCDTGAHDIGAVAVTLTNTDTQAATLPAGFAYVAKLPQTLPKAGHPKKIKNRGTTRINRVKATTVQGLPVKATVKSGLRAKGDFNCIRVKNRKGRKVTAKTNGYCKLRVKVIYRAPGNDAYLPFKKKFVYKTRSTR